MQIQDALSKFATEKRLSGNYNAISAIGALCLVNAAGQVVADAADKAVGAGTLEIIGAGTAYTVTNTAAAVDLGTTDPVLVLPSAGTWLLLALVGVNFNGATFAASQAVTLKIRRTNNTAADVTGAVSTIPTGTPTTITGPLGVVPIQGLYTGSAGDSLTIFAQVATAPGAGSLQVATAQFRAVKLF